MTPQELQKVKDRLERLKTEQIELKSSLKHIEAQWRKDYGISTVEDAEKLLAEKEEQHQTLIEKQARLISKLEEAMDV